MTQFRRAVRFHNATWREANGYPIGTHRVRPGTPPRLIGSQLDLDFARESGATFLTAKALAAARARTSFVEPHQIFDHQSFWADLLSSEALAVNLFGDLAADLERADRAVHTWWPATPGRVSEVRFAHSPGPLRPELLEQPPLVRRAVRPRAPRRKRGTPRDRRQVPRGGAAAERETEPHGALRRDPRPVRHLQTGLRESGQVPAVAHVARAPPAALDAPAREWTLDVGSLRRGPP